MTRDEFITETEQARKLALDRGADAEAAVREGIAETSWQAHQRLNRLREAVHWNYGVVAFLLLWHAVEVLLWWWR